MATTQAWTVRYHYEAGVYGGRKLSHLGEELQSHVIAANSDKATIEAVLNANGKTAPAGAVLVIDSVANAGPGQFLS
jgi:hypothetical protein